MTQRIHQLDGLRGLLALYVVVYHLSVPFVAPGQSLSWLAPFVQQAWYSVDVFFVMSGFVMAHVYGHDFAAGLTKSKLIRFFKARIARLHPVHLFVLLAMAPWIVKSLWGTAQLTSVEGRYSWQAAVMSLFMLHGPWLEIRTWNYPAWSISAEWHAYVLFPLMVVPLMRLRGLINPVLTTLLVCITLSVYLWWSKQETHPTNGLIVLARVLPLFMAGVLIKNILSEGWCSSIYVTIGIAGATVLLLFFSSYSDFAVILIPLLICCALNNKELGAILSRPKFLWLGKVSYSLYMTHSLIEMYFTTPLLRTIQKNNLPPLTSHFELSLITLSIAIALSLALAWLIWRWVEGPSRRWIMSGKGGNDAGK